MKGPVPISVQKIANVLRICVATAFVKLAQPPKIVRLADAQKANASDPAKTPQSVQMVASVKVGPVLDLVKDRLAHLP